MTEVSVITEAPDVSEDPGITEVTEIEEKVEPVGDNEEVTVEEKTELLASPRVKAAKRKLEEMREEGKLDPGIVAAISVRLRLLSVQVSLPTECSLQWDPGDLLYRTIQEHVVASLTMFLLYAVNEMLVVAEQGDVPIYVGCRGPPLEGEGSRGAP